MSEILLVTLNSTYQHTAFGLRYLFANLKDLKSKSEILEFTIEKPARDIAEEILKKNPKIVGFGVYIWNTTQTYEVISLLKKLRTDIIIVLGGPEVSHESESQAICRISDYVIKGEGDIAFYNLANVLLSDSPKPVEKFISAILPSISDIQSPYVLYTDTDIKNRLIYVEASRGCPYKCEYCLSSLDKGVRNFPLANFLADLSSLINRGAREFKFIDRTFNLSPSISGAILEFFLEHIDLGLFLHFEMVPDRLPQELKNLIVKFPKGSLQFEIGIQTWNPDVTKLVSRKNDYNKVKENFNFLVNETGVHIHADLIAGLPGETMESFASGFDQLIELNPQEIQMGILKRLKGAPISRHDSEWKMVYQDSPPFQILSTSTLSFEELQKISRFSKFWDLIANSGQFPNTLRFMKQLSQTEDASSFFWWFFEFSRFLSTKHPQSHSIALLNLFKTTYEYLTEVLHCDQQSVLAMLALDYAQNGRRDLPGFLKNPDTIPARKQKQKTVTQRQQNHLLT